MFTRNQKGIFLGLASNGQQNSECQESRSKIFAQSQIPRIKYEDNLLTYTNGYAIKNKWDLIVQQLQKEFLTDFSTSLTLIIFMVIPDMNTNANLFLLIILAQHNSK
ncbi:unnamed protein product [Paramecium octaurelia]|uniref:Uncharacterized protein n=1 Tax=Paramecium octaurelia TaxID=43137 RepID=A0A8S1Y5A1_PAROT|nr:unnamed protein product [Paramecium octaurelia]